ncbi:hypothetical protein [Phytohabitans houttuyneae]|nr:hypothetical protein [Phytohabitans houttuyneae]
MNSRSSALRRLLLVATAAVAGALMGLAPAATANAATATFQPGVRAQIPVLTFVVTNDTSEPDYDWRVEFDLPADTWPGPWPSPQVRIAIVNTATGRHITVSRASSDPYPIRPGASFQFTLPMRGTGLPTNCLVDGTVPCTQITP